MGAAFASVIATFITLPMLGYLIVFVITKQVTKQHKRSVSAALDVSTLLLIISVHYLIISIWKQSLLWVILLLLLFTAIIFVISYWKIKQEIDFLRIFKGFWRANFLIFFTAYIILTLIGIFQRVTYLVSMS
ncbi:DUF3397 domain-containing protein [Cytobacillus purgationiresistens]|uniref:Glucan phosphoethanolaminetransferase (Alkaline phosphatase superfamily) n=1 Tax=Cytobacillus purgationiresistens TaxID=863449 RepID=A0ABU0ASA2_9BACI|nr:DUF3397 domain-containing protein [Cytobacillus purgationiresistens]MDQ0273900.1 glucan phosphoethanolaminetransferase (alkaline phosphatase superfamily) [Cytobacillus purgationiresistens]